MKNMYARLVLWLVRPVIAQMDGEIDGVMAEVLALHQLVGEVREEFANDLALEKTQREAGDASLRAAIRAAEF